MSQEIYDNFNPKIKQIFDARLVPVSTYSALPDPNLASNFIPEGGVIFVKDVQLNYQAQIITGVTLGWVNIGGVVDVVKVTGAINITPTSTVLDCSLVVPAIATCHSVVVTIVGGTTSSISSITNLPVGELITFYTNTGSILTFVHNDYDVATANSIVVEDGFDVSINGRTVANESITFKNHGTVICQWDAVQFVKKADLVTTFLQRIGVINSLSSTSTVLALSAYQGNILNGLINTKQNILTAGSHTTISSGSTPIIASTRWLWVKYSGLSTSPTNVGTYLTSISISLADRDKYFWVDLRDFDKGAWLLPPGNDPTVFGNWFNIDKPINNATFARYSIASDAILNPVALNYNPRFITNTYTGDDLSLSWNSDGPANEKVCFTLPEGAYRIRVKLNVVSDVHNDHTFNLYNINGLTTAAAGLPVSNVVKDIATVSSPTTSWTDSDEASYVVDDLIIVGSSPGVGDGIILGMTTTSTLLSSSLNTTLTGYLDITKIR
jgi:hypothetical protein